MKNKIISYLNRLHAFRTVQKVIVIMLVLALFAYNFCSSVLRPLGATMTDRPSCGMEEHTHTNDCYGSVLICDHAVYSEAVAPIHDAAICYESRLICNKTEHVHTDECYSVSAGDSALVIDNGSDLENPSDTVSGSDTKVESEDDAQSDAVTEEDVLQSDAMMDEENAIGVSAEDSETILVKTPYGFVDKDMATNMVSGKWDQDNAEDNRYVLYVGETLEVAAQRNGLKWKIDMEEPGAEPTLKKEETGLTVSYTATIPGEYKITLTDGSGGVISTFYFEVRYPIFVETAMGQVHKDKVHEYLDAVGHSYADNPQAFITYPGGKEKNNALYVKNGIGARYQVHLHNSFTLSAYYVASANRAPTFKAVDDSILALSEVKKESVTINDIDFVKATVTCTANGSGDINVTFGSEEINEVFYVHVGSADDSGNANHFDIEIADGGTYTYKDIIKNTDGSQKIVTTVYDAYVDHVNYCDVYYDDLNNSITWGENKHTLEEKEYWRHNEPGDAQYELTSAYKMNGAEATDTPEDRPIDSPKVKQVVFNVKIYLKPKSQTIETKDASGTTLSIDTVNDLNHLDSQIIPEKVFTLKEQYILDAINKCPNHSGMDFTVLANEVFTNAETPQPTPPPTGSPAGTPTPTPPPTQTQTSTPASVDVTVDVVWNDDGKNRPDSVVIQLLKDGEVYDEVTLSESKGWHHTWSSLDGTEGWSVRELNVPNRYTVTYQRNGLHFTVINTTALFQTGQLNWPIPILAECGMVLVVLGSMWERSGRKKR